MPQFNWKYIFTSFILIRCYWSLNSSSPNQSVFSLELWITFFIGIRKHTGLTRVSSIRFLPFEIKHVLVFNSIIIYFTDLFIFYIFYSKCICQQKSILEKRLTNYVWWVKLWSKVTAFWNLDRTVKSTWKVELWGNETQFLSLKSRIMSSIGF